MKGDSEMRFLSLLVVALAALIAVPALAQDKPASNMEILREKIKADKKLVVAANMQLTQAEAPGFWPVYDAYQADLDKINARLEQAIKEYAEAYRTDTLTNEKAQGLMDEVLKIEQAEVDLKRAYVPKLSAVLSQVKVARYLQIENKIRAVLKYELAGDIPLAR
jgi:hypothetical protein